MKTIFLFTFFLVWLAATVHAQNYPQILFQKSYGGSADDDVYSVIRTSDSGFLLGGSTLSSDGDVTQNFGSEDCWLLKLDSAGNKKWQKSLGGSKGDDFNLLIPVNNVSFIGVGSTGSNDGEFTGIGLHGYLDFLAIKFDSVGNIIWKKCYGGSLWDWGYSVKKTIDNGFILCGMSNSTDGDLTSNHGSFDYWIVKIDSSGNILWQKSFGGSGDDEAYDVEITTDGNYLIAGITSSTDFDVVGNHGGIDAWVLKLDTAGNVIWKKCFGSTGDDYAYSIISTADEGYILAGTTSSADIPNYHGGYDAWMLKMDTGGNVLWQMCYGGSQDDSYSGITATTDSGYILGGTTSSNDGDVHGYHDTIATPTCNGWIVKTDVNGNIQFEKAFGGSTADACKSKLVQTGTKEYAFAAWGGSSDGDETLCHGGFDYWFTKISYPYNLIVQGIKKLQSDSPNSYEIYPNPTSDYLNFKNYFGNNGRLTVFNILGQIKVVQEYNSNETVSINVSGFAKGIYLLRIEENNQITNKKFIVY